MDAKIPLEATLSLVPCRGGESFLRSLFEPLGYEVVAENHRLDETFPDWGHGPYFDLRLRCKGRLRDLLAYLYVLVPVLDDDKHYWVGDEEVDKLLRHGAGWLAAYPAREAITQHYLRRQRGLGRKRSLALRQFALGVEALERFARGEPLCRVHECVFGMLALESEPVDPRL